MWPPSRTLRRTMTLLVAAGAVSCASSPTTSDFDIMSNLVALANAQSREGAVSRPLASQGATPVTVSEQTLTVPSEVEGCSSGHADVPPVSVSGPLGSYVVDCTAMADLAWGTKADRRTNERRQTCRPHRFSDRGERCNRHRSKPRGSTRGHPTDARNHATP
jgi:hypothetical protein